MSVPVHNHALEGDFHSEQTSILTIDVDVQPSAVSIATASVSSISMGTHPILQFWDVAGGIHDNNKEETNQGFTIEDDIQIRSC